MERKHRQLHREAQKHAEHHQECRAAREGRIQEVRVLERVNACRLVVGEDQRQDRDEHQQAARLREDEEFDRGVDAALVAPDGNKEIHGHEHQFPGEIEQEQVHGQENADDGAEDRHEV